MVYSTFANRNEALDRLPPRPERSHKGTFGHVLCVCGSLGMCGAAYLSAKAAYRSGAGLVRILTVQDNLPLLQGMLPEAIVTPYDPQAPDPKKWEEAEQWADVLVIGCGLGLSPGSRALLAYFLQHSHKPTVLDADALNLLALNPSLMKYAAGTVLTPHPLEMARLTGLPVEQILAAPESIARSFAQKHALTCVLKDHNTVISDGSDTIYRNNTGNSGMATGGSGDVLAGMLGGLWAQCRQSVLSPFTIASIGVYLHGLCGDVAAHKLGEYALMATDLIEAIPQVLR